MRRAAWDRAYLGVGFWGLVMGALVPVHLELLVGGRVGMAQLVVAAAVGAVGAAIATSIFSMSWLNQRPRSGFAWLAGWCSMGAIAGLGAAVALCLLIVGWLVFPGPARDQGLGIGTLALMVGMVLPVAAAFATVEGAVVGLLSYPAARSMVGRDLP